MVVAVLVGLGLHREGAARALLFGSAAGIGFALQAAVTKVFVHLIGHGVVALITSWTTYVLIVSALLGFVLLQSAFKTGVLAPAMASGNSVTLFASVVFAVTVFGESLSHGHGRLIPAVIGLGIALAGIVTLAGAKPPEAAASGQAPSGRLLPRATTGWGTNRPRSQKRLSRRLRSSTTSPADGSDDHALAREPGTRRADGTGIVREHP